jgi:hypothetical protein
MIPTISIDTSKYKEWIAKQIVPKPPDGLREIYEKRVLTEQSYIRAEMYDSPENIDKFKKLNVSKIPHNIQNPNYSKVLEYYDQIIKSITPYDALKIILELISFINSLGTIKISYTPNIYTELFDVRCCENLEQYFNYLLTFKSINKK